MESNSKLYVLKHGPHLNGWTNTDSNVTIFLENTADYGGAVYVDDDTNSGTYASVPKTECFFQVLATHAEILPNIKTQSMHFSQNYVHSSSSILYGGLLDRCSVSPFAEVRYSINRQYLNDESEGIAYFKDIAFPTFYIIHNFNYSILKRFKLYQTFQYHLAQSRCAFASVVNITVQTNSRLRLRREKFL